MLTCLPGNLLCPRSLHIISKLHGNRRDAWTVEPWLIADHKVIKLQTAKEILAEVFHLRSVDVVDMIQRRLEVRDGQEGTL